MLVRIAVREDIEIGVGRDSFYIIRFQFAEEVDTRIKGKTG